MSHNRPRIHPVGMKEIAERAGVSADTVKKWRTRHAVDFPASRWTVGGDPAWDWGEVLLWLKATNRAPNHFRWRSEGSVIVEETRDDDGEWRPLVKFVGDDTEGWQAFPQPALIELAMEPDVVAYRHLRQWCEARQKWVQDHPDEPMPDYMVGGVGK
jgi:hypothetical protein